MPPTPYRSASYTAATPLPNPDALPIPEGAACRIHVTFPVRMRAHRTHRCEVRAEIATTRPILVSPAVGPFAVRPLVPGCLVTPREFELEAAGPPMTFTVTPLAEGPIDARLDVWHIGQLCIQVPLRGRSVSRQFLAYLALATVVVPWLWYLLVHAASEPGVVGAWFVRHLPAILADFADVAERAAGACAEWEETLKIGFWIAVGLLAASALVALRSRVRMRTIACGSPVFALGPVPSTRTRPLPPYLTPVPPEELSHFTG